MLDPRLQPVKTTIFETQSFISVGGNWGSTNIMLNMNSQFYTNVVVPKMKKLATREKSIRKTVIQREIQAELPRYVIDLLEIYPYDPETIDEQSTPGAGVDSFSWVFKKYKENTDIYTTISKRIPVVLSMHDFKVGVVGVNPPTQLDAATDPDVARMCALQTKLKQIPEFELRFLETSYSYFIKKPSVEVAVHNIPRFSLHDIYFMHRHPFKMIFRKLRFTAVQDMRASHNSISTMISKRPQLQYSIVTFNGEVVPHKSPEDAKISIIALLNDVNRNTAAALSV